MSEAILIQLSEKCDTPKVINIYIIHQKIIIGID
jgi:hypothetical protein